MGFAQCRVALTKGWGFGMGLRGVDRNNWSAAICYSLKYCAREVTSSRLQRRRHEAVLAYLKQISLFNPCYRYVLTHTGWNEFWMIFGNTKILSKQTTISCIFDFTQNQRRSCRKFPAENSHHRIHPLPLIHTNSFCLDLLIFLTLAVVIVIKPVQSRECVFL